MIEDVLSRAWRIGDGRAAAALVDPMLRRLVLSFAREARTISDVAAESGIELKRLHHHVTRLCRLGLLRVEGERRRRGRPMKLYRAYAGAFFIPSEVAPELFTEPLSRELREHLRREDLRSQSGMLLTTDDRGVPQMHPVSDRSAGARAAEFWRVLRLDPADVEAIERDLRDVLDHYAVRATGRGKPYLIHAALALRLGPNVSVDNPSRG